MFFLHRLPLLILASLLLSACVREVKRPPVDRSRVPARTVGVVQLFSEIPASCNTVRGIKQKVIRRVRSEQELQEHYGLTFLVRFNDGVSPTLYGSMYYQNRSENRYCMALVNGAFAVFSDRRVGIKRNMIQEVCYPIMRCVPG